MGPFAKIGLSVAGIITLGYILMLTTMFGVTPTIQPRKTPAPDGFVASNFQILRELQSTPQIDVVNLNAFGSPFDPGFMIDASVLYITINTSDYDSFYIFFDNKGRELGRREKHRSSFPIGNTIVDINGFYTVKSDAIGPHKSYVDVQNGAIVPSDVITDLYTKSEYFYTESHRDFPRESEEYEQKINTHIFLINGVWTRARAKQDTHLSWKAADFPDFMTQYDFHEEGIVPERSPFYGGSSFNGGKYSVHQTWFEEQEYFRRRAASIGSPTGQGRAEHWRGIGYYTVKAGNDSIGFAIPYDQKTISGSGRRTMKVIGHEQLDFIMIERYAGNDTRFYIISTKD
jgi:hypothetical protein